MTLPFDRLRDMAGRQNSMGNKPIWRLLRLLTTVTIVGFALGGLFALLSCQLPTPTLWAQLHAERNLKGLPTTSDALAALSIKAGRQVRWTVEDAGPRSRQRLWALGTPVSPHLREKLEARLTDLSDRADRGAPFDPMLVWLSPKLAPNGRAEISRFRQRRWMRADPLIVVATDENDEVRWIHLQSRFLGADAQESIETVPSVDRRLDVVDAVDLLIADLVGDRTLPE